MSDISELRFFGNAGGTCKSLEDVQKLSKSAVTHIEVGSITVLPRAGNDGTIHYINSNGTSVNALGMPNRGLEYYQRVLPKMVTIAEAAGKILVVNIAPINQGDTEILCQLCLAARVKHITFNGGCPNAWSEGKQKKIISFDPEGLSREMVAIHSVVQSPNVHVNVKLSPYGHQHSLRSEAASVLKPYGVIVVTCNTLPNTKMMREDNNRPAISFRSAEQEIHVGGMGGTDLEPYALQELETFRQLLPTHPLISVGGISKGAHVNERLKRGAHGVQIGSAYYFSDDPHVFSDILTEYADFI
jgi:dihydroorotate dehydrogenase (fumarate)